MEVPSSRSDIAHAPGSEIVPGLVVVGLRHRGTHTETYDVRRGQEHRRLLVKIVRRDQPSRDDARDALVREGRLLCESPHPCLVRAHRLVMDPRPALVLQDPAGSSLRAVTAETPLPAPVAARMGTDLADALEHLHRHGWLHLDLRRAHVIVRHGRAVLLDLGRGRPPGPDRALVGATCCPAPEQVIGDAVGPATDVWCLAVTLVESLTAGGLAAVRPGDRSWQVGPLGSASRALDRVPRLARGLRRTLLACLDPRPGERPTVLELRGDLATTIEH